MVVKCKEKPLVIISNHNIERHKKTEEVAKMTRVENRHIWISIDSDNGSIESIKQEVEKHGYIINNIIIGGTNTSGCVFRSKAALFMSWAKKRL